VGQRKRKGEAVRGVAISLFLIGFIAIFLLSFFLTDPTPPFDALSLVVGFGYGVLVCALFLLCRGLIKRALKRVV
jgi:hypothetical protein